MIRGNLAESAERRDSLVHDHVEHVRQAHSARQDSFNDLVRALGSNEPSPPGSMRPSRSASCSASARSSVSEAVFSSSGGNSHLAATTKDAKTQHRIRSASLTQRPRPAAVLRRERDREDENQLDHEAVSDLLAGMGMEDEQQRRRYSMSIVRRRDPQGRGTISHYDFAKEVLLQVSDETPGDMDYVDATDAAPERARTLSRQLSRGKIECLRQVVASAEPELSTKPQPAMLVTEEDGESTPVPGTRRRMEWTVAEEGDDAELSLSDLCSALEHAVNGAIDENPVAQPLAEPESKRASTESAKAAEADRSELLEDLRSLRSTNEALQAALDVKTAEFKSMLMEAQEAAQTQLDQSESQLAQANTAVKNLRAQLKAVQTANEALQAEVQDLKDDLESPSMAVTRRRKPSAVGGTLDIELEDADLRLENAQLAEENARLEDEVKELKTLQLEVTRRLPGLPNQPELMQQIEALQQEIEALNHFKEEAAYLKQSNEELRQEIRELHASSAAGEVIAPPPAELSFQAELTTLLPEQMMSPPPPEAPVTAEAAVQTETENPLDSDESFIHTLDTRIADLAKAATTAAEEDTSAAESGAQPQSADADINSAADTLMLEEMQARWDVIMDKNEQLLETQDKLHTSERKVQTLERAVAVLQAEKSSLATELESVKEAHAQESIALLSKHESRKDQLERQKKLQEDNVRLLQKLKIPLLEVTSALQVLRARNEKLGQEIASHKADLAVKQEALERLSKIVVQQKTAHKAQFNAMISLNGGVSSEKIAELQGIIETVQKRIDEQDQKMAGLLAAAEASDARLADEQTLTRMLREEVRRLTEELEAVRGPVSHEDGDASDSEEAAINSEAPHFSSAHAKRVPPLPTSASQEEVNTKLSTISREELISKYYQLHVELRDVKEATDKTMTATLKQLEDSEKRCNSRRMGLQRLEERNKQLLFALQKREAQLKQARLLLNVQDSSTALTDLSHVLSPDYFGSMHFEMAAQEIEEDINDKEQQKGEGEEPLAFADVDALPAPPPELNATLQADEGEVAGVEALPIPTAAEEEEDAADLELGALTGQGPFGLGRPAGARQSRRQSLDVSWTDTDINNSQRDTGSPKLGRLLQELPPNLRASLLRSTSRTLVLISNAEGEDAGEELTEPRSPGRRGRRRSSRLGPVAEWATILEDETLESPTHKLSASPTSRFGSMPSPGFTMPSGVRAGPRVSIDVPWDQQCGLLNREEGGWAKMLERDETGSPRTSMSPAGQLRRNSSMVSVMSVVNFISELRRNSVIAPDSTSPGQRRASSSSRRMSLDVAWDNQCGLFVRDTGSWADRLEEETEHGLEAEASLMPRLSSTSLDVPGGSPNRSASASPVPDHRAMLRRLSRCSQGSLVSLVKFVDNLQRTGVSVAPLANMPWEDIEPALLEGEADDNDNQTMDVAAAGRSEDAEPSPLPDTREVEGYDMIPGGMDGDVQLEEAEVEEDVIACERAAVEVQVEEEEEKEEEEEEKEEKEEEEEEEIEGVEVARVVRQSIVPPEFGEDSEEAGVEAEAEGGLLVEQTASRRLSYVTVVFAGIAVHDVVKSAIAEVIRCDGGDGQDAIVEEDGDKDEEDKDEEDKEKESGCIAPLDPSETADKAVEGVAADSDVEFAPQIEEADAEIEVEKEEVVVVEEEEEEEEIEVEVEVEAEVEVHQEIDEVLVIPEAPAAEQVPGEVTAAEAEAGAAVTETEAVPEAISAAQAEAEVEAAAEAEIQTAEETTTTQSDETVEPVEESAEEPVEETRAEPADDTIAEPAQEPVGTTETATSTAVEASEDAVEVEEYRPRVFSNAASSVAREAPLCVRPRCVTMPASAASGPSGMRSIGSASPASSFNNTVMQLNSGPSFDDLLTFRKHMKARKSKEELVKRRSKEELVKRSSSKALLGSDGESAAQQPGGTEHGVMPASPRPILGRQDSHDNGTESAGEPAAVVPPAASSIRRSVQRVRGTSMGNGAAARGSARGKKFSADITHTAL